MAKHLTNRDIELLVSLIDGWNGKLTWEALCDQAEGLIGTRSSRQTLNAHAREKSAFLDKKIQQKSGSQPTKRPASLAIAEQRIQRLESQNQRLKSENGLLFERFIRWQYNAQLRGLSQVVLDTPLPRIDRDSAEEGD